MELDELRSAWNEPIAPGKSAAELHRMLSENKHPVLKGIRRQLAIEIAGWSALILCYYTMLDGERKPLWLNALLLVSVLLPLMHNLLGYRIIKNPVSGANIITSLYAYRCKIKRYALIAIACRVAYMAGLLLFLTYNVHFDQRKLIALGLIGTLFAVNIFILYRVWHRRSKSIAEAQRVMV
jgi:hypothetical protein